jgi:hypothetical protein
MSTETTVAPQAAKTAAKVLLGRQAPPATLVIFGATGDLTHRKLVPALYNLAADGDLPPGLSVVGFARRDKNDEIFRTELEEAARRELPRKPPGDDDSGANPARVHGRPLKGIPGP